MEHYFEARSFDGRVTSAYWMEEDKVSPKAWREDHIIRRCSEVGGACNDNDETIDYRGSGWYASMMEAGQVFTLPVLLDIEDYDREYSREGYARLRAKSMCLGTIFRIE